MEGRAMALAALGPDTAAMQLDEFLADWQPDTGGVRLLRERVVEALERLEEPRQVPAGDADAGIGHGHVEHLPFTADLHQDLAGGRELDGVRHEIEQHL